MKFRIEDNHLLIFYENGKLKEDATNGQNECKYCLHKPKSCNAKSPKDTIIYGGQFCDSMRCKYQEIID